MSLRHSHRSLASVSNLLQRPISACLIVHSRPYNCTSVYSVVRTPAPRRPPSVPVAIQHPSLQVSLLLSFNDLGSSLTLYVFTNFNTALYIQPPAILCKFPGVTGCHSRSTTVRHNPQHAARICTVPCSALATGITLGATKPLRLISSDLDAFLFDGRYPQLGKVFLNLDNPEQDPATKSAMLA